jgi:3-oxoacyl-[acyl-carrier-protein] synthase-3
LLAHRLGLSNSGGIDLAGACAGFLYSLTLADGFARTHDAPVLVVAANILSRRTNPAERASCILFADAAGAVVVAPATTPGTGVLGVKLAADGSGYGLIGIPGGGSRNPFAPGMPIEETWMTIADGRAVFSRAVDMMASASRAALERARTGIDDIDYFVPHQANGRMIAAVAQQLGVPEGKVISSVAQYGNSSAATIPLTLSVAGGTERFKRGGRLLMCAAGAGLTGGAVVFGL